jgi:polysaccharide pyruvyl transferase WcaK-like protein
MRTTLNVFNFWGSGNIGDDLMLAGFLAGLDRFGVPYEGRLASLCSQDMASQRLRFPAIRWIDSRSPANWRAELAKAELLIGTGDTPFQLTSGDWFLKYLAEVLQEKAAAAELLLINVGAEQEIFPRKDDFARVLRSVTRCSTRDVFSYSVLEQLPGAAATRLSVGGDFANLSLERLAGEIAAEKAFPLGVVLAFETLSRLDLAAIRSFLQRVPGPVAFVTGDCRDGPVFEYGLYKSWTKGFSAWLSPLRKTLVLRRPSYSSCSLRDLAQAVAECEVILSSRYHGLLVGAWLGCRVAAIGRSSKVSSLARELGIPCVDPPIQHADLERAVKDAAPVPRRLLTEQSERAAEGLLACKFW